MTEQLTVGLVLDCHDPQRLAPFWEAALGYVTLGAVDNYVVLAPDGGSGPRLLLQKVPEPKSGKNRMHLDIYTPLVDQVAARLEQLCAKRISSKVVAEHGQHWMVMNDPEGNEFCVCDGGPQHRQHLAFRGAGNLAVEVPESWLGTPGWRFRSTTHASSVYLGTAATADDLRVVEQPAIIQLRDPSAVSAIGGTS